MNKPTLLLLIAALLGGCIVVPPPPNRSAVNPADTTAPESSTSREKSNLIAGTRIYLDPAVGEGAQKMNMKGMGDMEKMDHSKMQGMKGMDHSQVKGMEGMNHALVDKGVQHHPTASPSAQPEGMGNMDHSKMKDMAGKKQTKKEAGKKDASTEISPSADVYTCVMHPEVKQSKPGKCPKCGMTLVRKNSTQKEEK